MRKWFQEKIQEGKSQVLETPAHKTANIMIWSLPKHVKLIVYQYPTRFSACESRVVSRFKSPEHARAIIQFAKNKTLYVLDLYHLFQIMIKKCKKISGGVIFTSAFKGSETGWGRGTVRLVLCRKLDKHLETIQTAKKCVKTLCKLM